MTSAVASAATRATPPGALDVARLRRETPGTAAGVHLNAAGASLMPRPVLSVLHEHLERESLEGGYDAGYQAAELVERFYSAVARLINARPDEIAYVDSGSRAWAMALHSVPMAPGDKMLLLDTEYQGNWIAARRLALARGVTLEVVPQTGDTAEDVARVLERVDAQVRLVAAVHVPSNNGLTTPVAALGRELAAQPRPPVYLVDACQSVGQLPVDVRELSADLLVGTGRKYLRGPRGSAFLFASERRVGELAPIFLDAFSTLPGSIEPLPRARCFETWESHVGGKIGLGRAVEYLLELDAAAVTQRIAAVAAGLRARLSRIAGVEVLDLGAAAAATGLVTFRVRGHEAEAIWRALGERRFRLDTCQVQGTLLAPRRPGVDSALRASVHYYNTEHELDLFAQAIEDISRRYADA